MSAVPASIEEATVLAASQIDYKTSRMISNLASVPTGSFVWTQMAAEEYRLGRLSGPWRYENTRDAEKVGIFHVRPTGWLSRGFTPSETPPAVLDAFSRGGRNFQQIRHPSAGTMTRELFEVYG